MKHQYMNTEFGMACYGCGIMAHMAEADPCDGRYIPFKLAKLDDEITKLQTTRARVIESFPEAVMAAYPPKKSALTEAWVNNENGLKCY